MKTDTINLSWGNDVYERAIGIANRVAEEIYLNDEETNNLIRLTEETLSMVNAIFGGYEGELFYNVDGSRCELVIQTREEMSEQLKDTLIRMSSSGENQFKPSFVEKLTGFIKDMGNGTDISALFEEDNNDDEMILLRTSDGEVWDETERAILHHYADEVTVSINKKKINIKVIKDFTF